VNLIGGKVLLLRWATTCVDCGRALALGERAMWFHLDDVGRCMACADPGSSSRQSSSAAPAERATPSNTAPRSATTPPPSTSAPGPAADPAPKDREIRDAGASAQAEYERRRKKDKVRTRQNLPRLILFVAAAPVVGFVGVRIGADLLGALLRSITSSAVEDGVDTEPMFDRGLVHLGAISVAVALTVSAVKIAFGR